MKLPAKLTNKNKEDKNREQNTPTLVLSVIGDSNTLVPNQWPKDVFQEALIETAKCEKGKVFYSVLTTASNGSIKHTIIMILMLENNCIGFF